MKNLIRGAGTERRVLSSLRSLPPFGTTLPYKSAKDSGQESEKPLSIVLAGNFHTFWRFASRCGIMHRRQNA
ncbi:MAG TPA: hypothetical protein PKC13_31115, partial [Blastocatellia bacterium]|nr:hypothetical protein [Blastocatellia bacterium]